MSFYSEPLVAWTPKGLFCAAGNFYIDPHRAVDLAIVTHAHSDHARRGSKKYICVKKGIGLLKSRIGQNINVEGFEYGEQFVLGDVTVSLHSAGHILASSQVRIQRGSEVWVASGDYKRELDPSCDPFESVKCDTFITEATFGTPKFTWDKSLKHGEMIIQWWKSCALKNKNALLFGYSLGKAQRILAELAPYAHRPVLIHSTVVAATDCYRNEGMRLAPTLDLNSTLEKMKEGNTLSGELILAPPSILMGEWVEKLGQYETAFASGWMQSRRSNYDHGFVMSDHADWNDLNLTIKETGAKRVFVQHRDGALIRHLKKNGLEAFAVEELTRDNYSLLGGTNLRLI